MQIKDKVALITGAASGIGRAAAQELIKNDIGQVALVDVADTVHEIANELNKSAGREVALPFQGDTTDEMFRKNTYDAIRRQSGVVNICIPAAGITRDAIALDWSWHGRPIKLWDTAGLRRKSRVTCS